MTANSYIGIDLGGTNIAVGLVDDAGHVLSRREIPTHVEYGPEQAMERIVDAAAEVCREAGLRLGEVTGVGIGSPGPIDVSRGLIISSANLPGWVDVPLRGRIAELTGRPTLLENDANAAAFGEFWAGAGRGCRNMVLFTLGTGIGGGVIVEGRIVHGSWDNAGELGHVIVVADGRKCGCGQRGCIEAYASATATAARAAEALAAGRSSSLARVLQAGGRISSKDVYEHAVAGDELAAELFDDTARYLAVMCVNMTHIIEPQRIVFSGGMTAAGELLLGAIRRHFRRQLWRMNNPPVEIVFAQLGEAAGFIGAAGLARQAYIDAARTSSG